MVAWLPKLDNVFLDAKDPIRVDRVGIFIAGFSKGGSHEACNEEEHRVT